MTPGGRNVDSDHSNGASGPSEPQESTTQRRPSGQEERPRLRRSTNAYQNQVQSYTSLFPRGYGVHQRLQQVRPGISDYLTPITKLPQGASMVMMPGFPAISRPSSLSSLNMTTREVLEMAQELTSDGL
jgi:hypothetical protein